MPGESWSHETAVDLRRRFLRKLRKVLVVANIFLLLMTHRYQSINKDAAEIFEGHNTFKWIYYAFEALYAAAHLVVSMELSSRSTFHHARTIFGTLGFEILLWLFVSHHAWLFINVAVFNVALLCALGKEFLHFRTTDIYTLDDGPMSEFSFNPTGNGPTESGLDAIDAV